MLSKMNQQINRLTVLISDLLDATRIEQGKLILRKEQFDFNKLVEEVIEEVQRTTNSHRILTQLEEPAKVYADRDRIGQVITNFLTNALKYSPKSDKVEVHVGYQSEAVNFRQSGSKTNCDYLRG